MMTGFDQDCIRVRQIETLLGQGTVVLEFEQQASAVDTLLVSVGGGGLIAGIAAWYRGKINLVGVEPEAAPTLTRALEAGHPVDAEAGGIAADSLAPRRVGELVFPIVQRYVSQTVLVTDDAISNAQRTLENAANSGRAGWRRCICGINFRPLCAPAARAGGCSHLRWKCRRC
jgi:threonine dehydratase